MSVFRCIREAIMGQPRELQELRLPSVYNVAAQAMARFPKSGSPIATEVAIAEAIQEDRRRVVEAMRRRKR